MLALSVGSSAASTEVKEGDPALWSECAAAEGDNAPPNHFIVLMDGSGSMRQKYQNTLFNGIEYLASQKAFANPKAASAKIKKLVAKTLGAILNGKQIPLYKPERDWLSFVYFTLDWNTGDYENFLLTPAKSLLLTKSTLDPNELYVSSPDTPRIFNGQSPIVAATSAILPYIGKEAPDAGQDKSVGCSFIIRITDGDYNSNANAADEAQELQRQRKHNNINGKEEIHKYADSYAAHLDRSEQVKTLFDIGSTSKFCLVTLQDLSNKNPVDCGKDAYNKIDEWNKTEPNAKWQAWLVSYLQVKPKIPDIRFLVKTNDSIDFRREKDPNDTKKIKWVAHNSVTAIHWQDSNQQIEAVPIEAQFESSKNCEKNVKTEAAKIKNYLGQPAKNCPPTKNNSLITEDHKLDCETLELDGPEELQGQKRDGCYTITYRVSFTGTPRAYPLDFVISNRVNVKLDFKEETYQPNVLFGLPGFTKENPEPITNALLLGSGASKASELTEQSRYDFKQNSLWRWIIYPGLLVAGWSLFPLPLRRWKMLPVQLEEETQSRIEIDFNRSFSLPILLGQTKLTQTPPILPTLGWLIRSLPCDLHLKIPPTVPIYFPKSLSWKADVPVLGIGNRYALQHDKLAIKDTETAFYFNPGTLDDYNPPRQEGEVLPCDIDLFFTLQSNQPGFMHKKELQSLSERLEKEKSPPGWLIEHAAMQRLRLLLHPEDAKFFWTDAFCKPAAGQPSALTLNPSDKSAALLLHANYGEGKPLELVRYTLKNNATKNFCKPACGILNVTAQHLKDGDSSLPEGAFYLLVEDAPDNADWDQKMPYRLYNQESQIAVLMVNLEKLGNPFDPQSYDIRLVVVQADGRSEEKRVRFTLERSRILTDLELVLLDRSQHKHQIFKENTVGQSLDCDLQQPRLEIPDGIGLIRLFHLTLRNHCQHGHGYANWRVSAEAIQGDGVSCRRQDTVVMINEVGADISSGTILDDHTEAKRAVRLKVCLKQPNKLKFTARDAELTVDLKVRCEKFSHGANGGSETLEWTVSVPLSLRHKPACRVLAIDFGTSAISIAHGVGEDIKFLPLANPKWLKDKAGRLSQGFEAHSDFLSADASLHQAWAGSLSQYPRPLDKDYLDLPAHSNGFREDLNCVYPSLKLMLVRGWQQLPVAIERYPYTSYTNFENKEISEGLPLMDDVLHGVFAKLREEYVKPILGEQGKDFTYFVATHPNTYTVVERERFRKILSQQFAHMDKEGCQPYPENIHLLGESDAVLNFYLLNYPKDLEEETIFIWDIGAGTLDMTLAKVRRERKVNGSLGSPHKTILDRYGVEAAGHMLTECIARDLDAWLDSHLGSRYETPIVENPNKPFTGTATALTDFMWRLRGRIETFKRELTSEAKVMPAIELVNAETASLSGVSFISTNQNDIVEYNAIPGLRVASNGAIYWQPDLAALQRGDYVSAFIERVADAEVKLFLDGVDVSTIDTVIVSGRSSLWPGLRERLRQSLPGVKHWEEGFAKNPEMLKKAVVEGAVISQTRWEDVRDKDYAPPVFGEYVIKYESGRRQLNTLPNGFVTSEPIWKYDVLPNGIKTTLPMDSAMNCFVGIRHKRRFQTLFYFPKANHSAGGSTLSFTMNADEKTGHFNCSIENALGGGAEITQDVPGEMHVYKDILFWPITHAQLTPKPATTIAQAEVSQ